jgi:hypothetical protein
MHGVITLDEATEAFRSCIETWQSPDLKTWGDWWHAACVAGNRLMTAWRSRLLATTDHDGGDVLRRAFELYEHPPSRSDEDQIRWVQNAPANIWMTYLFFRHSRETGALKPGERLGIYDYFYLWEHLKDQPMCSMTLSWSIMRARTLIRELERIDKAATPAPAAVDAKPTAKRTRRW